MHKITEDFCRVLLYRVGQKVSLLITAITLFNFYNFWDMYTMGRLQHSLQWIMRV